MPMFPGQFGPPPTEGFTYDPGQNGAGMNMNPQAEQAPPPAVQEGQVMNAQVRPDIYIHVGQTGCSGMRVVDQDMLTSR